MSMEEKSEKFEEKLGRIADVMKIEGDHITKVLSGFANDIGLLKFKGADHKDLVGGTRAAFSMVERKDELKVEAFGAWKNGAPIVLIKQKEQEGKFVDDDDGNQFDGSMYEREASEGLVHPKQCTVKLEKKDKKRFFQECRPGDVFRFASRLITKNIVFWDEQKQKDCEIFHSTLRDFTEGDPVQISPFVPWCMPYPRNSAERAKHNLGPSQYTAYRMAKDKEKPLVFIDGPPGSGKTHTLAVLILRTLKSRREKEQMIVLAPNEKILKILKDRVESFIEPCKERMELHEHALMDMKTFNTIISTSEGAVESFENWEFLRKNHVKGDLASKVWEAQKHEFQELQDYETQEISTGVGKQIMKNVRIVFATIDSPFIDFVMEQWSFNPSYCIIDEAAQIMESQFWPAVHKMPKIVMAGDPKQLQTLVWAQEAKQFGLGQSIMERLQEKKKFLSWALLQEQYRLHEDIAYWLHGSFYDWHVITRTNSDDVLEASLNPDPRAFPKRYKPIVLIDTSLVTSYLERVRSYEGRDRGDPPDEQSYSNYEEAEYAMKHYENLLNLSIAPETIAIITPYSGQACKLKARKWELMERLNRPDLKKTMVGTVDDVLGQEYDCVIFTMVRSNPKIAMDEVTNRLLNTALTRARKHTMLIANGFMLEKNNNPHISHLFCQLRNEKLRLHPYNLHGAPGPVPEETKNNFGANFGDFIAYSNDEEMKEWCRTFIANGGDPEYREKKNGKSYEQWGKLDEQSQQSLIQSHVIAELE